MIFTNIQTLPSSNGWLHELSACIDNDTEMVLGYETKKGLRMQLFDDIYEGFRTVEKEERKRSTPHRRCIMKLLRGHYDFVAVPQQRAHMLLSHYETDIKGFHLFGRKVSVFLHNLF